MSALLKPKDRAWIARHMQIAQTTNYDFESFAQLFLTEDQAEAAEVVQPKKSFEPKPYTFKEVLRDLDESENPDDPYYADEYDEQDRERDEVLKYCRKATFAEYYTWLEGYLKRGGKITHTYPNFQPMYVVVRSPAYMPELYGANSLNLIVPEHVGLKNIRCTFHGMCGHSSLFFMRDFTHLSSTVPSFRN